MQFAKVAPKIVNTKGNDHDGHTVDRAWRPNQ